MDWKVPLADLNYDVEEEQAALAVLRSRWLTLGAVTQRFEQEFGRVVGSKHALAVSNATVALHLACRAVGLGPGDEVIAPSLSFVATTNAALYTGASVRFADIRGADDLTLAPQAIEAQITPRTRAIIVMHYGGYPCQMVEIMQIARRHGLAVIEDAAHAPGAWLNDPLGGAARHLGTWGDVGCFSFFSNKNLSTGEGGMLVTDRDDIAAQVRLMRSHGMTSLTWDRHQGHAYSYDVVELGYNYRIDEIHSALGLVQLEKLSAGNARRAAISRRYWQSLHDLSLGPRPLGLPFSHYADPAHVSASAAYHIFPILLPAALDRLAFIDRMRAEQIQTSIHYPPIHQFTYYRQRYPDVMLPFTEDIAAREVTLPLYPTMTDEQVSWVIEAVRRSLAG